MPGVTLLATNLISMFGLHRRWRGALVGHLAMFEMTSSVPNGRYARGHRRLGGGEDAALFFDEHVVADSVHDQIALHDLAGGLAQHEPRLVDDIVFGARCAAYADAAFAQPRLRPVGGGCVESATPGRCRDRGGVVSARARDGVRAARSTGSRAARRAGVSITVCPDGPLLVRGPVELLSADGETVEHGRRVVALCRCGRSRLKPLCDGSHRLNRFRDPATADQISHVLNRARPVPTE